jgi:hypothetical protein
LTPDLPLHARLLLAERRSLQMEDFALGGKSCS